ncbi:MAG TPA: MFS transporter [Caulobacteraceae bacterium]|nr:MFS transporter [Caulobacteraceae bacterium]
MTTAATTALPSATRLKIYAYVGVLIVLLGFGNPNGGLIEVPITFFLKNRLHLAAHQAALFRLVAAIPLYLAIVFGFARDTFNPLGMRDRGFLVVFGAATSALYVVFAFSPITYGTLLAAVVLSTTAFLFVWSAQNGLTSALGQQHMMSGRIAAAWSVFLYIPVLSAYFLGGALSQMLEGEKAAQAARILFLVGAAIMATVALFGLWRPPSVYDNLKIERAPGARRGDDFKRLIRHWPIYPALTVWLLWSFAPGSSTPLQYFLQNSLHATDAQWGEWNAIFVAGFIPTFLLFGWLCQRFPLRGILFWSTLVAVPQMVPLAFIHDVNQSFAAAALIGLLGGVNSAAYLDLVIRSCPPGLQGAVLMMWWSLFYIAVRFGDVLGTYLYDRFHDFNACVIAITVVYALILPVLQLVPRRLTATADGQAAPAG